MSALASCLVPIITLLLVLYMLLSQLNDGGADRAKQMNSDDDLPYSRMCGGNQCRHSQSNEILHQQPLQRQQQQEKLQQRPIPPLQQEQQQQPLFRYQRYMNNTRRAQVIGQYARYNEVSKPTIDDWTRFIGESFPDVVKRIVIGQTFERRNLIVLQIGTRRPGKRGLWLDGGIHGREHIAPATVIYLADQLLRGHLSGDDNVVRYMTELDWYFMPLVNPDGYEYTHTHDRLWRKNRRPVDVNCTGVDLNRNWDIDWGGADSSSDPCSNLFMGPSPHSETEVNSIVDFLLGGLQADGQNHLASYITYHSYGQRILTRWDYTARRQPEDSEELLELGDRMSWAMRRTNGVVYDTGLASQLTYVYGGGSADWARATAGIKYSYLIELRDSGFCGFLLPRAEIEPTGAENWAGIQQLAIHILKHMQMQRRRRGKNTTYAAMTSVELDDISEWVVPTIPEKVRGKRWKCEKTFQRTNISSSSSSSNEGVKELRNCGSCDACSDIKPVIYEQNSIRLLSSVSNSGTEHYYIASICRRSQSLTASFIFYLIVYFPSMTLFLSQCVNIIR